MEIPRFAQNYTGRFVSADKDRQKLAGKEVSMDENTRALKGVPFDLAGHVDYSDGSVVSKITMESGARSLASGTPSDPSHPR